jgi:hypothetical protein
MGVCSLEAWQEFKFSINHSSSRVIIMNELVTTFSRFGYLRGSQWFSQYYVLNHFELYESSLGAMLRREIRTLKKVLAGSAVGARWEGCEASPPAHPCSHLCSVSRWNDLGRKDWGCLVLGDTRDLAISQFLGRRGGKWSTVKSQMLIGGKLHSQGKKQRLSAVLASTV